MANAGYRKFLISDYWRNTRLKIIGSKRGFCCLCLKPFPLEKLNVHHISYKSDLKSVPMRWLKVLCQDCHIFLHQVEALYKEDAKAILLPRERWHFLQAKVRLIRHNQNLFPMEQDWEKRLKN